MEYISLYRKYRPNSFSTVVGQKPIIKTLLNSIASNRISHAYIFAGSKGIGKTSIAKIFAKAINCLAPVNGDACNNCDACKLISSNQTTDIIELDAASNNGVEEIRKIIESVGFLPVRLKYKVYIIDEAHMLTTSAWNALLKTIEEPPHHAIFIFATTEVHKIPATIISRCQNFQFSRMAEEDAKQILNRVCGQENIKIDEESISKIIQLANGSARDLLSILDQLCLYTNNNISVQAINEIFGLVDFENKILFIDMLVRGDLSKIINEVNKYSQDGINFNIFVNDLISIFLDKLIYDQTKSFTNLKILNKNNINSINLDRQELIRLINIWQKNYIQIKTATDAKSVFMIGVFECLNNTCEHKEKQPEPQKTKVKIKIEHPTIVVNEQPKIEENTQPKPIFKFTQLYPKKDEPKEQPIKVEIIPKEVKVSIKPTSSHSLEEIFLHIAKNTSKDIRTNASNIINSIKDSEDIHACFNPIVESKQVVVASNNGIVLLFDDESDAYLLNKNYLLPIFQKNIVKFFKHTMYIIGFTKSKINDLVKLLKSDNSNLPDIEIDSLNKLIDDNSSILSLAQQLFSKEGE